MYSIQLFDDEDSARFRWWGPGAQAWWEAPYADTESLGRG